MESLKPADTLNDLEFAKDLDKGRVYFSGSICSDLVFNAKNNHPVLPLCFADRRHPISPFSRWLLYFLSMFIDLFFSVVLELYVSRNEDGGFSLLYYFMLVIMSFNSNLMNYIVKYLARSSEKASSCCLKCLGKSCLCLCCCYMLLATIGIILLNADFCDLPAPVLVSNGLISSTVEGQSSTFDLSQTYSFHSWADEMSSCGDTNSFANYRAPGDDGVFLYHLESLKWGQNISSTSPHGYWLFGTSLDASSPPWSLDPNVYAVTSDWWYGPSMLLDAGQAPVSNSYSSTNCPTDGCWSVWEGSMFTSYDLSLKLGEAKNLTVAILGIVGNSFVIFAILHIQGWITWFLWAVPLFCYKYSRDAKYIAERGEYELPDRDESPMHQTEINSTAI